MGNQLNKKLDNQLQLFKAYRKKKLLQENLNKQLIEASKDGNLSQVKSLIIEGADIHDWEDCALNEAAHSGHLEVVKYLVEDCEANVHPDDECTLRWAAEGGHLEIVKYLVSKGANVHVGGNEALRKAVWKGHLDVVKYLVSKGANVHAHNELALSMAAEGGHLEVVKYLVEDCDADVHVKNEKALHWAKIKKRLDVVKYLKTYKLSQFTKKHIDKQNLRYVFQQYELPFEIKQIISSYVLNKVRTDH